MSGLTILSGADVFDGYSRHVRSALLIENGSIKGIVREDEAPATGEHIALEGGLIIPGFIDLQVNGGGGVMLNDFPDVETIGTICTTHCRFGTTALLATLITDRPDVARLAVEAASKAAERRIPGFLGLHLEGPHLAIAKKGAHEAALIRPMGAQDVSFIVEAKSALENLLVTVAPEVVSCRQIETLAQAGIIVSLGHSNTSFEQAGKAAQAGARSVTHIYNAMSPLTHRDAGLVGAALENGALFAGLIADGFHVDPTAISIALRSKNGPGKIYLVSDAMSTIGTDMKSFTLNGRTIRRSDGRLTLEDGTLAGADLDMISAVHYMAKTVGTGYEEAIRMASLYPAQCMGIDNHQGHLQPGAVANFCHLDESHNVCRVWINGVTAYAKA